MTEDPSGIRHWSSKGSWRLRPSKRPTNWFLAEEPGGVISRETTPREFVRPTPAHFRTGEGPADNPTGSAPQFSRACAPG